MLLSNDRSSHVLQRCCVRSLLLVEFPQIQRVGCTLCDGVIAFSKSPFFSDRITVTRYTEAKGLNQKLREHSFN